MSGRDVLAGVPEGRTRRKRDGVKDPDRERGTPAQRYGGPYSDPVLFARRRCRVAFRFICAPGSSISGALLGRKPRQRQKGFALSIPARLRWLLIRRFARR